MDYQYIQETIDHFKLAIERLEEITPDSHELTGIAVADEVQEHVRRALAALSAAVNPQLPHNLSSTILKQLKECHIPLDDLEVRVALANYHHSQVVGVLNEIKNRYAEIRRYREYFLMRLPQQPIEELGSRLPLCQASDFDWPTPITPPETLAALKRKYNIDRLKSRKPTADIFSQIDAAQQAWAAANPPEQPPP